MPAHVVVSTPDPIKTEGAKKYAKTVHPLLKAAGVAPKLRGPVFETLASENGPASMLVTDFQNRSPRKISSTNKPTKT